MDDTIPLSRHAQARARQRGVSDELLAWIDRLADVEIRVGRNLVARWVSARALWVARRRGLAPAVLERLQGLVVVEADDGTIVTVGHLGRRHSPWRRRKRPRFWR
ncbi:MAG: hypothetical protein RMK78_04195 [Thermaurantiacus sp.]|uniref:hypothetical protein n=1 Tax=Thermaurantiacus sp. TaxID=2820283 RepID=UPI00298EF108|nr:hypothetical protein [Thermaurantiacus sp.]MDW8414656.1 hypothetical protein [Thermaurantiacus sp.]